MVHKEQAGGASWEQLKEAVDTNLGLGEQRDQEDLKMAFDLLGGQTGKVDKQNFTDILSLRK